MPASVDPYDAAVALHSGGKLHEAELAYREILARWPQHSGALHMLGMLAHQCGKSEAALRLMARALELDPTMPSFVGNLAVVLAECVRYEEAIAVGRHAIELSPGYVEAYNNLGNALRMTGRYDAAVKAFENAIRLRPDYADAYNNLANTFLDRGQTEQAITAYRKAIELRSDLAEAHQNLGVALEKIEQLDEAITAYRRALELRPHYRAASQNLATALIAAGRGEEAQALLQSHPALPQNGRIAPARLESQPPVPIGLGDISQASPQSLDTAIAACQRSIGLRLDGPEAYYNLGNALALQAKYEQALAAYRKAIELHPDYPPARNNLGSMLKNLGRLDEAMAEFKYSAEHSRDPAQSHSNYVYTMLFHPGIDQQTIAEELRRWNDRHARALYAAARPRSKDAHRAIDRDPHRPLRIGYVSPDLRDHVVGRNILPILSRHDRSRYKIFCYAGVQWPDDLTKKFRAISDGWENTFGMEDQRVADMIRRDRIDILVDLSLHMSGSRLLVFAHKPAPIQVTWAGYPGSTGLEAMDYRITDAYLDPPGLNDAFYSEKSLRLPDSFWCFDPLECRESVNPLPALRNGYITFGCLNNFCKVNGGVIDLWAKVLQALPTSRLMMLVPAGSARQNIHADFRRHGIEADRVQFVAIQPREKYLATYHQIDIALDTFPYNGHTTSLDALWMGVPLVTLYGQAAVSRAGLCQLSNLGLAHLAKRDPEAFVGAAVELASDSSGLSALRARLRSQMETSPLMEAARFTLDLEQVYRQMWDDFLTDEKQFRGN